MAGQFEGLVAWITGGGSGIGRALARELASRGARVAVSGRRQERLDEVVAELDAAGHHALAVPLDVTDDEAVQRAVDKVVGTFGRMDIAVANAGVGVTGWFTKLTDAEWRRQLDVNVLGAVSTARWAVPRLQAHDGRMVFVASVAGFLTTPRSIAYSASKAAVRMIGLGLAAELHGTGVTVTTIHPGFVQSEIARVDNQGRLHADKPDPRPQKFMWPTDKAARVMADAIYKRKREFVFTGHGKVGAFVGQHMPGMVYFATTRKAGGKSKGQPKESPTK